MEQQHQHHHQQQQQQQLAVSMPVIIHYSLVKSPLSACLHHHHLKVRVSERTTISSVIFPVSKVAFFCLTLDPGLLEQLSTDSARRTSLRQSVAKFVEVHGHGYVVMVTDVYGDKEWGILEELQKEHLNSRLQVIPAHSHAEAASAMVDIAKLQCRPLADKMRERFCGLLSRLLLEETGSRLLAQLGLDSNQIQLVQDGVGNMAQLARASVTDLTDRCALDRQTALRLANFFADEHSRLPVDRL